MSFTKRNDSVIYLGVQAIALKRKLEQRFKQRISSGKALIVGYRARNIFGGNAWNPVVKMARSAACLGNLKFGDILDIKFAGDNPGSLLYDELISLLKASEETLSALKFDMGVNFLEKICESQYSPRQ